MHPWSGNEMLGEILSTLEQAYVEGSELITPAGGDESIMTEVQRLVRAAYTDGYYHGESR